MELVVSPFMMRSMDSRSYSIPPAARDMYEFRTLSNLHRLNTHLEGEPEIFVLLGYRLYVTTW